MKLVTSKDQCLFPYEVYEELVQKKLATKSFNEELNLITFKYAKKVMFDRLWNTHPALMECRGVTFDATTKELKALPFRKSFNYLENNWWKGVSLDTYVNVYKKYNGFMGCITPSLTQPTVYSTTGSTKSDFVGYIKEIIPSWVCKLEGSNLFEVMHPDDPHIVKEEYLFAPLGIRNHETGVFELVGQVSTCKLSDVLVEAKTGKGEGWMVYHLGDAFHLSPCKIKTDYYVGKKKLMRMTAKNVELMYKNPVAMDDLLPDLWEEFPRAITELFTKEDWLSYTDQERRIHIEELENNW